jgi:hypothetical protein
MRTVCKDVFKFEELSDEAKERARQWYREATAADDYPLEEIVESLKGLFKAAGIKLQDWSLGAYNQGSFVKFDLGDAAELTGSRAVAWLENNLFGPLRITRETYLANRKDYLRYGWGYRIGSIAPYPFTGICYDEDLIDGLRDSIKGGDTLKDAFRSLADVCGRIAEKEYEYQNEDEQVDESIIANEYEFTADGRCYA